MSGEQNQKSRKADKSNDFQVEVKYAKINDSIVAKQIHIFGRLNQIKKGTCNYWYEYTDQCTKTWACIHA